VSTSKSLFRHVRRYAKATALAVGLLGGGGVIFFGMTAAPFLFLGNTGGFIVVGVECFAGFVWLIAQEIT
jgi:hypothetical protein